MDLQLPEYLADIHCCKQLRTRHHLQVKPPNLLERTQARAVSPGKRSQSISRVECNDRQSSAPAQFPRIVFIFFPRAPGRKVPPSTPASRNALSHLHICLCFLWAGEPPAALESPQHPSTFPYRGGAGTFLKSQ